MDLDELRALIAVVETGSFSAAAKSLRFARATLRRRIDELEARLGVPLLERDGASVRPTTAGAMLARRGPSVLAEARTLMQAIRSLDRTAPQELHLVGLPGPPPDVMVMGLRALAPVMPNIQLRLTFQEDPTQLPDDSAVGLDLAETAPEGSFTVRHLFRMPIGLWAERKALAKHPIDSVDALLEHPIAAWRNREGALSELRTHDGERIPFKPAVLTSDLSLLSGYATAGVAIAYGPRPPGRSRELSRVLPDLIGHDIHGWLLTNRTQGLSEVIEHLARFAAAFVIEDGGA